MKSGKMVNARKGLQPLEFEECIVDSPEFRENLNRHEKELDHTSQQIKRIIKEVRDLVNAAKILTQKQRTLATSLKEFNFECIGSAQTDDEQVISASLRHFGKLIENIEEEREKMLRLAHEQIIDQLEDFRKKQIGAVKENKKKFDKKTEKFCQSQERVLNMSTKKPGNAIQEAEASLGMHKREYIQESLSYVLRIQEVQERIKFEFVEILLAFISGWLVFYHAAHDQGEDDKEYLTDLRHKVQKTRENFNETREKVNELKSKYMEKKTKPEEKFTKRGYLFLMEKKPFKATWSKYYCTYKKQPKEFTMLQFNQITGRPESPIENLTLISCTRRSSEFEKRFCFDLLFKEKPGATYTFQALSDEDYIGWINAMDGTEPTYLLPGKSKVADEYQLDEVGFLFVKKCIEVLESRGLEDEGIYRKSGVGTKITKLLSLGMDRKKIDSLFIDEQYQDLLESNTIASALKTYLRNLNEPLMTYQYHAGFIAAAKQEGRMQRINDIHTLVHCLPKANFDMLEMVIKHLTEVSKRYEKNKMSVFNLGVVFGPTLLRPLEETVAAILDIKFNNIVINILIDNYELIFKTIPGFNTNPVDSSSSRLHQVQKSSRGITSGGASYSGTDQVVVYTQQPVLRSVTNYTDQSVSSSLQSIPNGIMYHGSSGSKCGVSSTNTDTNVLNQTKSHHKMPHMTLSDSDIRVKSESTYSSINSPLLSSNVNLLLNAHNSISTAKNKDYMLLMSGHPANSSYGSSKEDSVYINAGNNISPRSATVQSDVTQFHGQTHTRHSLYPSAKQCTLRDNKEQINSTSSSNESVCDSVLSSRDNLKRNITGTSNFGRLHINSRSFDCSSNTTGSCEEVTAETYSTKYLPKKMDRSKDVNQIKTDLALGTARVRTLYACLGENEGELSFEPNQIITNVRFSHEPGWLQGTLNGKTGLIPENYVEILKSQH